MSRSKLVVFLVLITLFVALLIVNDIRWNFTTNDQTHITLIAEAKYGEEWEQVIAGARAAASEFGVELRLLAPDSDYEMAFEDQINLIEASRTKGTEGIILAPIDTYELSGSIVNTSDSGIPVLSIITPVSHLGLVEYIGTDHYDAGVALGEMVVEQYGKSGDLAIVSIDDGDPNLMAREAGLRDYMRKHSSMTVADTYRSVKDTHSIKKAVEAILVSSKFEVVVGLDLRTTEGIAEAVKEQLYPVKVYGVDISDAVTMGISKNYIDGVVVQNYFNIGYLSVESMTRSIEDREVIGTQVVDIYKVTSENIYSKESQMILFPIK